MLLLDLPFRRPVGTAVGVHRARPLVLVRLRCRTPHGPLEAFGECAALADASYDGEDAAGAFAVLAGRLAPDLAARARNAGGALPAAAAGVSDADRRARPLAAAALEAAVADAHLRAAARPLADLLGVTGRSVPAGAVVGTHASPATLVDEVASRAAEGYSRVKVKIGPGWDDEPLAALAAWAAGPVEPGAVAPRLQADANGAYGRADVAHLAGLDAYGLACLEQPLARDDLAGHALLSERMATPVCLDESLDSPVRVAEAVERGACSVVCLKPSRLGGIGPALEALAFCRRARVPVWVGGMFESGYGRGVLVALAGLCDPDWAGDVAPAAAYLDADLAPGPTYGRDPVTGVLRAVAPAAPGLGPPPAAGPPAGGRSGPSPWPCLRPDPPARAPRIDGVGLRPRRL